MVGCPERVVIFVTYSDRQGARYPRIEVIRRGSSVAEQKGLRVFAHDWTKACPSRNLIEIFCEGHQSGDLDDHAESELLKRMIRTGDPGSLG